MLINHFKYTEKYFLALFSLISVLGLSGCQTPAEKVLTTHLANNLQAALQDTVDDSETKFPGALLTVSGSEFGTWSGAAGLSNVETSEVMLPENRFRAASILKSFIAVIILQLMEEGRLILDDPMTVVLPESVFAKFSGTEKITVRMLLNHTSGIPDWLTKEMMGKIFANPQKVWEVNEYLDVAAAQEPYFPPGEGWKYSNTDYNLLGLIIAQMENHSWRDTVRERIIKPLNLENTVLPEPGDLSMSKNHARGYFNMGGQLIDLTEVDSSMADAAGGNALITTASDLARFLNAVMDGELFQNTTTLEKMLEFITVPDSADVSTYPMGYGLGVMRFSLPGDIVLFGHSGNTGGFSSFVYYLPNQSLTIAGVMTDAESSQFRLLLPALEVLFPDAASQR